MNMEIKGKELLDYLMTRFSFSRHKAIETMKANNQDISFLENESGGNRGSYAFMSYPTRAGTQFTFENGWTISIMWSSRNYCDNYCDKGKSHSDSAEVGIFDENDEIIGDVWSYQTADEVAKLISQVANGTFEPIRFYAEEEV